MHRSSEGFCELREFPGTQHGTAILDAHSSTIGLILQWCDTVFGEPQFGPALIHTLIEDTAVKIGVLDALGAAVTPGPDAYFQIMRNLANGFAGCLDGPS